MNIFNYFPELKKDTDFSLYASFASLNLKLAWIGPRGTISGLHADNVNNMYAQIQGRKLFIIASRRFNKRMYPSKKYIPGAIGSQVDLNDFDEKKFPKFREVEFSHVILEPGDVLFLPKRWWHYVESLDTSISINNFGYNRSEKYTIALLEHIKDILHRKGWFKPDNCLCHKIEDGKRVLHD
ncbi:MAG: cupin-like domain-containing protein, partial [Flavobacteriaceae bacterium]